MPNENVEQSLADLSIAKISDSCPELMKYLLGFELISGSTNEESSRAAGLLGFKIGSEMIYVPSFFLNGAVKACGDIGYIKSSDTFFSLTPQWISYLASRSSGDTGAPSPDGRRAHGVPTSAMRIFNQAPQISNKRASFVDLDDSITEFINPDLALQDCTLDLPTVLKSMGKQAYVQFMDLVCDQEPKLLEKIALFYDLEEFKIEFPEAPTRPKTAAAEKPLAFATLSDISKNPTAYTNEQKEAAFLDGIVVLDKRAAKDKSQAYLDDYRSHFSAPAESGFYEMVNAYGDVVDVFIARQPMRISNPSDGISGYMIIDPKSGVHYLTRPGEELFVKGKKDMEDDSFEKAFSKMKSFESVTPHNQYIAISESKQVSAPFHIENKVKTEDYTSLKLCCGDRILRLIDRDGDKISSIGKTTMIPKGWKVMEVADRWSEDSQNKRDTLKPGSFAVLTDSVRAKNIKPLSMSKSGSHYLVRHGDKREGHTFPLMKRAQALFTLIAGVGMDEGDARAMIERTDKSYSDNIWVKSAISSEIYGGMPFPEEDGRTGANEYGIPEQWGVQQSEQIPMNNPEFPDVEDADLANFDRIKQQEIDFLSRAADSENKNVFDPAMIGIILKGNRTQANVDQWVPDLVSALDKLCRLLLLFYWKNSDFAQSYGKDEMAEFEDVLLNNIKNMGTIVLFLKQRAGEAPDKKIDALA